MENIETDVEVAGGYSDVLDHLGGAGEVEGLGGVLQVLVLCRQLLGTHTHTLPVSSLIHSILQ